MKLKVSKTLLAWQYCILTCSADVRGDTPATALAANLGKNKLQYVICCTLWCTTTWNHSNLLLAALSAINIANFGYPSDSNGSFDSLSCSRYNFFYTASNIQTWKHYCERLLCSLFLPGGEDANSLRIILTLQLNSTSQTVYKLICVHVFFFPQWQSQFKSQGNKLIPDSQEEQALMYQHMFEGLTFYDKLSKTKTFFCANF